MLGLKPFVQESVQGLAPAQLRLLAETLRVDLRGCDDRGDIERVLTGLVCLDQDTSLGVFLAWLRASNQQHDHGLLAKKKTHFSNTFLPTNSVENRSNNKQKDPTDRVKEHHLDDEITQQLTELAVLEGSFKAAERLVHTGSPSFDKLKRFLLELTALRAKEESARAFLVRQAGVLREKHDEMRAEMLHSRAQLDFFVDGFTNLRKRHDALLEDAARRTAESEATQELFASMSAHDCHFEQLMRNTLSQQRRETEEMKRRLEQAHDDLEAAAEKRKQLESDISGLKQARGDAQKDAYCSKRQLRSCKLRLERLQEAGGGADGSFFRAQAVALRQAVATLVGLLQAAVLKDTKSPKQTLSKEALRVLSQVLAPGTDNMGSSSTPLRSRKTKRNQEDSDEPRLVQRAGIEAVPDLDEVVRGVLLVEGATESDAAVCARLMGEKLKYLPIDLKQTLMKLRQDEERQIQAASDETHRQREQLLSSETQASSDSENHAIAAIISSQAPVEPQQAVAVVDSRPPPMLEEFMKTLKQHVTGVMMEQGKRGFVMYNWPFARRDVDLLTAAGLPVDSVVNLEVATEAKTSSSSSSTTAIPTSLTSVASTPSSMLPPSSAQAQAATGAKTTTSSSGSRAKAVPATSKALGRTPASPSKLKTSAKPGSKASAPNGSGSRAASPVRTPAGAKKQSEASTSSSSKVGQAAVTPTPASPQHPQQPPASSAAKRAKKIPTAASALQGLGGLLQPVGPASFPAERVTAILQVLEQQKRRKLAPIVQWDEATRRTNELLAMWAEEVRMLLHLEQESRKPKKPAEPVAASSSSPAKAAPQRAASPPKTSAGSVGGSKAKAASPTRTAQGASPSKAKTASTTSKSRLAKNHNFTVHFQTEAPSQELSFAMDDDREHSDAMSSQDDEQAPLPLSGRSVRPPAAPLSLGASSIDASVFAALPPDIQQELLAANGLTSLAPNVDDSEPEGWTCRVCTFVNHPQLVECEMCDSLCVADDDLGPGSGQAHSSETSSPSASSSRLGRNLRKLRFPATPATTSFAGKAEPTAEDLLVAATAKLQLGLQSARASWKGRRSRGNSAADETAMELNQLLPSLQAMRELTELQRDLTHKCLAGDEWFEAALQRLWLAIYPENGQILEVAESFDRNAVDWVAMGFQNASPETDFRGGGILALKCLLYAFEAHPTEMLAIRAAQAPQTPDGKPKKRWYPVCVAGINLTCLLAGLLQLGDGRFAALKEPFWPLFEEPAAFYELFYLAFVKMDAVWHRLNATYMEFGVVLKVTRKTVAFMLSQAPRTLMDLRAASDQAFIDRFVVSLSAHSLADWEGGECPDPNHVLEAEDALIIAK
ncbi:hypothetical protein BBJ28_00006791, partial [Nothophytophthora sp. Chile5]